MKIQKIHAVLILWMVSQIFLYGQENESVSHPINIDSISFVKNDCGKTIKIIGMAVPSAMVMYGFISLDDNGIRVLDFNIRNSIERNHAFWHTYVDDYLQFAPAVAAFAMKLFKTENAHNLADISIIYGLSNILAGSIVTATKNITGRERPDHSNNRSFPSGHTQVAFVAAEFLHQEFKDRSIWISVGGYSVAALVGIARVYNNKHWVSDVVAGAGIGILSTKAVYRTYPYLQKLFGKKNKPVHAFIFPVYSNRILSLNYSCTF